MVIEEFPKHKLLNEGRFNLKQELYRNRLVYIMEVRDLSVMLVLYEFFYYKIDVMTLESSQTLRIPLCTDSKWFDIFP